jgi:Ca2+-dependent lipid-binding protein
VHNGGGKTPRWNDVLTFQVHREDEVKIEVYDQDTFKSDLVGETVMFLDEIKKKGTYQDWIKIAYKGKEAGLVK